ncbi:MAG: glycosyltransferase family 4 protein, partial [Bacillota bacterium]
FHGYQPIGPTLSAFYDRADIFITASQSSEGFPRTIWEAMAHSLPVIATGVGSIPDFIGDAAVIIEPQSVSGIVDAINFLISNPTKRQNFINMGQELAKENTLNRRSLEMISEIDKHLETIRNNGK